MRVDFEQWRVRGHDRSPTVRNPWGSCGLRVRAAHGGHCRRQRDDIADRALHGKDGDGVHDPWLSRPMCDPARGAGGLRWPARGPLAMGAPAVRGRCGTGAGRLPNDRRRGTTAARMWAQTL